MLAQFVMCCVRIAVACYSCWI